MKHTPTIQGAKTYRPASEYHEDYGAVLWWNLPVAEPPYVGSPLDVAFDHEFYTHWTELIVPDTDGSELL